LKVKSDDPFRADFNRNGIIDAGDLDRLAEFTRAGEFRAILDLDQDGHLAESDRYVWLNEFAHTTFGDSNFDGRFDSRDLVTVFQTAEYEDAIFENSGWADGDWNGDGDFNSRDFVLAFQYGSYEKATVPIIMVVPEPMSLWSWSWLLLFVLAHAGRSSKLHSLMTVQHIGNFAK
jgi:hypothetical protein